MTCFAVTNIVFLLLVGVDWIFLITTKRHFQNWANETCRLWTFIYTTVSNARIWFAVVMVREKYNVLVKSWTGSLWTPPILLSHKAPIVCVVVGLVVVSAHSMWLYMYNEQSGCFLTFWEHEIYPVVWQWVSTCVYTVIPLALLAVFIPHTIYNIYKHGTTLRKYSRALRKYSKLLITKKGKEDQLKQEYVLIYATLAVAISEFVCVLLVTVTDIVTVTYPSPWSQQGNWETNLRHLQLLCTAINWTQATTLLPLCLIFSSTFRHKFLQIFMKDLNRKPSRDHDVELTKDSDSESDTDISCQ